MTYSSGILKYMVTIRNKVAGTSFGDTTKYEDVACVHAQKYWKHGVKGLREGALDAYDKVMFRMRWNNIVTRDSLLVCEGRTYQVLTLEGSKQDDQIEILAQEMIQDAPTYVPPTPNNN